MALSGAVSLLKAAADPTRLRLLALLAGGEVTVGELVEILRQSQPRVSRHLKLLAESGLVSHFRDGHWVYYQLRPESGSAPLIAQVIALARDADPLVEEDRNRLKQIRRHRERTAHEMPTGPHRLVDTSATRPTELELRASLDEVLGSGPLGDVLDVGTGSGTILRLLGGRARRAVGVDAARGMRVLARSRVQEAGLAHCTIRAGDAQELPFPDHSFDVVVLDEVLTHMQRPELALPEAFRTLKPSGHLIILDRILPTARRLPKHLPNRGLFENQLSVMLRECGLRLTYRNWFPGRTMEHALFAAVESRLAASRGTNA
jgi:ArsR family transcriptional regulator